MTRLWLVGVASAVAAAVLLVISILVLVHSDGTPRTPLIVQATLGIVNGLFAVTVSISAFDAIRRRDKKWKP